MTKENEIDPNSLPEVSDGSKRQLAQELKIAKFWQQCDFLPKLFRENPANCLVAIKLAELTGMEVLAVTQSLSQVNGKWRFDGKFCTALVNNSKRFKGNLRFRYSGTLENKDRSCTAWAVEADTGEILECTVDSDMVRRFGWESQGLKMWVKMPDQMFAYRAASMFVDRYAPELKMGMGTVEDEIDIQSAQNVEVRVTSSDGEVRE